MRSKLLILTLVVALAEALHNPTAEQTATHWRRNAQQFILSKLRTSAHPNLNRARNIILFMGDGMSLQTVAAARMYLGGEQLSLSFEDFPHFGLSKTYAVNHQVSDSANTATALLHGVKSTYGTVGVNAHVALNDCAGNSNRAYHTESLADWAQQSCKATGLVTTARVTHASPAGVYAHTANREWENDAQVHAAGCDVAATPDIARQMLENPEGAALKVILGCGRREFRPRGTLDEDGRTDGSRADGRDLIAEWKAQHKSGTQNNGSYVWSKNQLDAVDPQRTDYLLGLFAANHCPYHRDIERHGLSESAPSLSDMTLAAIRVLDRETEGYFLFVESARIDHAHHRTMARKVLEEMEEFSRVVDLVRRSTNESDTLLVVTSDHSQVMTYNGYSKRGNDILGLTNTLAGDGLAYPTLSYANGPGFYNTYTETGARHDLRATTDFTDPDLEYVSMSPMNDEKHGGDDVGVYASGPWSHLFTGNYEQNNIPLAMAFAARIGAYAGESERQCSDGGKGLRT